MGELVSNLSDCGRRLVLPESVCRKYRFNL